MEQPVVYTLGYGASGADETLARLLWPVAGTIRPAVQVLDIRLSPRSRLPLWRREALIGQLGDRYVHLPSLGNRNYKDRSLPIVLGDPETGLREVVSWLDRGESVCLLCACAHVEKCHRRLVADLLHERVAATIVHL